jgi:hypothetical protein
MYEVRLFFQTLRKEFFKFRIFHSGLCLREIMVHYYTKHCGEMFMGGN